MYLQLKISINNLTPPVWRRIVLSDQLTLNQLHQVIQKAFDWDSSHLAGFSIKGYDIDLENGYYDDEVQYDVNVTTLADWHLKVKNTFTYTYDFGDDWRHKILVEKISPTGPDKPYCLKGKRCAPPDDIGGPFGFMDYLYRYDLNKVSNHEKEVFGEIDSEYYCNDEVNERLSRLRF